jgi:hypothetical protein
VHGRRPGLPSTKRPAESSVSPSTSFIGSMHASALGLVQPLRQRQLQQDAIHFGISTQRLQLRLDLRPGSRSPDSAW